MEHLSLKRLLGGGLGKRSFNGNPGRYTKKFSRYRHLSPWGPFSSEGKLVCGGLDYICPELHIFSRYCFCNAQ